MPELSASSNPESLPGTKRQCLYAMLRSDYLKLIPILALAAYIAFIPHMDYPYPVHLDEWSNLAMSEAIMETGDVGANEPYYKDSPLIREVPDFEAGFNLLLGIFQITSSLSWMIVFRYLPSIIFVFTVLSAYIIGKRKGFGWEAAIMSCFIPTTVGILGPGFLVAVALGLPFVLLSLYLAFNFRNLWNYVALFLFMCFLLCMHPPTAMGLGILIVPYIVLNLKGNLRHAVGLALGLGVPFFLVLLIFGIGEIAQAMEVHSDLGIDQYIQWPKLTSDYGYLPILFCLVGVVSLFRKGGKEGYGLILGFLLLLLILVIYVRFHHGLAIMYVRGLMYTMLMMGIIGGYGLVGIRDQKLPDKLTARVKPPILARNGPYLLYFFLIVIALALAIPTRQDMTYYHMVDDEDYKAFVWIRDNPDKVPDDYDRAVLDPWKATAFNAITKKKIYTRITISSFNWHEQCYEFLEADCSDTDFLKRRDISIVYSRGGCDNPDLEKVRDYVYLLKRV